MRARKVAPPQPVCAVLVAALANAQDGDVVRPKSREDVQADVVLPTSSTCERMIAFDVKLGGNPSASSSLVRIVRTNVEWSGHTTVSEFVPSRPMPPFARFFLHETPQSHKVSWAMGAAFFASPQLALEAGAQFARWYASALGAPREAGASGDMYLIRKDELSLTVVVDQTAVRVSCEHGPTETLALQERLRSGDTR